MGILHLVGRLLQGIAVVSAIGCVLWGAYLFLFDPTAPRSALPSHPITGLYWIAGGVLGGLVLLSFGALCVVIVENAEANQRSAAALETLASRARRPTP